MTNEIPDLSPQDTCSDILGLVKDLAVVEDPRRAQARHHPLIGVLVMALCSIAAGADGWEDIADTADLHFNWFKEVVECGDRAPSADTFRRVIQALKPNCMQAALEAWLKRCSLEHRPGRQVCFDGKALRGAQGVHIVNAYDPDEALILAQVSVGEKQNEISAFPALQNMLDLRETVCTGDAMFTQRQIVKTLRAQGADYVLALKANQGSLFRAAEMEFGGNYASIQKLEMVEKNRGWVEQRTLRCSTRTAKLDPDSKWTDLQCVLQLTTRRSRGEEFTLETRYYIASLEPDLEQLATTIRGHWGIENGLHRTLDVLFKEDACQVREKTAAANLSLLRKLAGSILRRVDPDRTLKSKMKAMLGSAAFRTRFIQCDW